MFYNKIIETNAVAKKKKKKVSILKCPICKKQFSPKATGDYEKHVDECDPSKVQTTQQKVEEAISKKQEEKLKKEVKAVRQTLKPIKKDGNTLSCPVCGKVYSKKAQGDFEKHLDLCSLRTLEEKNKLPEDGVITKIKPLKDGNGYLLNEEVKVFNIAYSGEEAGYDVEYNEHLITESKAIRIAEYFFIELAADVLAGNWVNEPPKMIQQAKGQGKKLGGLR